MVFAEGVKAEQSENINQKTDPRHFYKHKNAAPLPAMLIYKKFIFDSAHFLPNVPEGHKCKNMHGHTYQLTVFMDGPLLPNEGWVIDYGVLKRLIKPIIDQLDHHCLNEIPGLENPTSEILAVWLWNQVKPLIPALKRVELNETASSGVIYEGE